MHSFFATLFTLVFFFSHGASQHHGGIVESAGASSRYSLDYTPTHRELLRAEVTAASYAGAACISCRRMNAVYRLH